MHKRTLYMTVGLNIHALKSADVIDFSQEQIKNAELNGISSDCFSSTRKDGEAKNQPKVFDNAQDFHKWYDKYHDISRTKPTNIPECSAEDYFEKGYYAVVISPSDLLIQKNRCWLRANILHRTMI